MSVETTTLFAQVIQDHLDLKSRNSRLDPVMPIDRYLNTDPFENHPLFKTEEQARIEETMDGVQPFPADDDSFVLAEPDVVAHALPEAEDGLWARSRDFDWGD
jgi:hypothetical protein